MIAPGTIPDSLQQEFQDRLEALADAINGSGLTLGQALLSELCGQWLASIDPTIRPAVTSLGNSWTFVSHDLVTNSAHLWAFLPTGALGAAVGAAAMANRQAGSRIGLISLSVYFAKVSYDCNYAKDDRRKQDRDNNWRTSTGRRDS